MGIKGAEPVETIDTWPHGVRRGDGNQIPTPCFIFSRFSRPSDLLKERWCYLDI